MVFLLRGTLSDGGSIFGKNQLTTLMQAEVGIGNSYWIIYLYLPPPKPTEKSLDVGQILSDAFHLGLTGLSIKVQNAGFFQLNAKAVNYPDIVKTYPEIPFPTDEGFITEALTGVTCFWGIIDFSSWDIGASIITIGGTNGGSSILKLYGFFASGTDFKTTIFEADFPDFTIFNTFAFSNIKIQYIFNTQTLYDLSGKLAINAFDNNFVFEGRVQKQTDRFFAALQLTIGPTTIENPFGPDSMPGVTFLELKFALLRLLPPPTQGITSMYWFQANVNYEIVGLTAGIYLENSTPVLAFIEINNDLDIGAIFTHSIKGFTWPSSLINIVFRAGSSLYYCKEGYAEKLQKTQLYLVGTDGNSQAVGTAPSLYQDGFNIFASIDLTIWKTISFSGNVRIAKQGVSGAIQLNNPIDLYILSITAPQGTTGGGPIFKFDSNPPNSAAPYVQLGCNLLFFEANFGLNTIVTLTKQNNKIAVSATLSTNQSYPILNNQPVTLTFGYSESTGFTISNWPDFTKLDGVGQIIDIAKEAMSIMKKIDPNLVCGAISDLISEVAYTNKFTMKPTFNTVKEGTDDVIYFVLNGTFAVSIAGKEVTSIDFPKTVSIKLPPKISLDSLWDNVGSALKDAAESFASSLINNGEQWAKLAAILFAEQATALAAQWLCEGIIDGITAEAIASGGAAVMAAGGAGAAGAVAAGIAAVAGIFSSCFTAGTEVILSNGEIVHIENVKIGDSLKGYCGIPNKVLDFDRPKLGKRKLYSFNGGPYFVTSEHPLLTTEGWKSIDTVATLKENPDLEVTTLAEGDILLLDDGTHMEILNISATEADEGTQLYNFKLSGNNTYIANGLVAHNKGSSCFVEGTRVLMANGSIKNIENIMLGDLLLGMDGMQNEVLAFDHPFLKDRMLYAINDENYFVTAEHPFQTQDGWKAIDPAATARENSLLSVSRLIPGDALVNSDGTTTPVISISEKADKPTRQLYNFVLNGNNTYYANGFLVHNKGGGGGDNPSPAKPDLNSPALTFSGGTLTFSWDGASYATGYQVEFYDPKGNKIGDTQNLSMNVTQASTAISLDFDGGSYLAKVRSIRGDKQSDWNSASIEKLANVKDIKLSYDTNTNKLLAAWSAVDKATGYAVTLKLNDTDASNNIWPDTNASYDADTLQAGTYSTFIFAQGNGVIPGSAVSGGQSIVKPVAPDGVTLTPKNDELELKWTATEGIQYTAELLKDNTVMQRQDSTTGLVMFNPTEAGVYSARVCVAGSATSLPGAWGVSSGSINKLAAPQNVHFAYDAINLALDITWGAVTGNEGYRLQIISVESKAVVYEGTAETGTVKQTIQLIDFTASGGKYAAQVSARAAANDVDSAFTVSAEQIERIDAPANASVIFNNDKQELQISWSAVNGNNGYDVILFNESTPTVTTKQLSAEKDIVSAIVPLSELELTSGIYRIKIATLAQAGIIISSYTVSADDVTKLASPEIQSAQFAYNLVTVIWNAVQDAETYEIAIVGEGGTVSKTTVETTLPVSVSNLVKGLYNVTVIAVKQGYISSNNSLAVPVTINPVSLNELALQYFTAKTPAVDAGKGIMLAFAETNYIDFAVALATAGYVALDTTSALKESFPNLTAQQITTALKAAYDGNTPEEYAKECKEKGWTAMQTGQGLVTTFQGISPTDFAVALAKAGYVASDTTAALKASFPNLTAKEVTAILKLAYSEKNPNEYAKECKDKGWTSAQTGQGLLTAFPDISPADFVTALVTAGYSAPDSISALKDSFKNLEAHQVVAAIKAAYNVTNRQE